MTENNAPAGCPLCASGIPRIWLIERRPVHLGSVGSMMPCTATRQQQRRKDDQGRFEVGTYVKKWGHSEQRKADRRATEHKCFYRTVEREGQFVTECETCKRPVPASPPADKRIGPNERRRNPDHIRPHPDDAERAPAVHDHVPDTKEVMGNMGNDGPAVQPPATPEFSGGSSECPECHRPTVHTVTVSATYHGSCGTCRQPFTSEASAPSPVEAWKGIERRGKFGCRGHHVVSCLECRVNKNDRRRDAAEQEQNKAAGASSGAEMRHPSLSNERRSEVSPVGQFEKWATKADDAPGPSFFSSEKFDTKRNSKGEYIYPSTFYAWRGWQAASSERHKPSSRMEGATRGWLSLSGQLGFEVDDEHDPNDVLIRDSDSSEWTSAVVWARSSPETVVTMLRDLWRLASRLNLHCPTSTPEDKVCSLSGEPYPECDQKMGGCCEAPIERDKYNEFVSASSERQRLEREIAKQADEERRNIKVLTGRIKKLEDLLRGALEAIKGRKEFDHFATAIRAALTSGEDHPTPGETMKGQSK